MEREFHRSQEKLQFAFLWHYILSVQRCSELKGDKAAKSGEIEVESGDEHNHTENHKPCNMSKESGNSIPIPHKGQGIAEKLTLEFTFHLWCLMGLHGTSSSQCGVRKLDLQCTEKTQQQTIEISAFGRFYLQLIL